MVEPSASTAQAVALDSKCAAELVAADPACRELMRAPALARINRDVIGLVCEYVVGCEAVGRWCEARDQWADALHYYLAATQFESNVRCDYKTGFIYMVGMNATRIDLPRGLRLLQRSAAAGRVEASVMLVATFDLHESNNCVDGALNGTIEETCKVASTDACTWLREQVTIGYGDYSTDVYVDHRYTEVLRRAESGCAHSQFCLGNFFLAARIVRFAESMKWHLTAARRGHAWAQNSLWFHRKRLGTEALDWRRRSAEQGHAEAMWAMGHLCSQVFPDSDVKTMAAELRAGRDPALAAAWFQRAADAGCSSSRGWIDEYRKGRTGGLSDADALAAATAAATTTGYRFK